MSTPVPLLSPSSSSASPFPHRSCWRNSAPSPSLIPSRLKSCSFVSLLLSFLLSLSLSLSLSVCLSLSLSHSMWIELTKARTRTRISSHRSALSDDFPFLLPISCIFFSLPPILFFRAHHKAATLRVTLLLHRGGTFPRTLVTPLSFFFL